MLDRDGLGRGHADVRTCLASVARTVHRWLFAETGLQGAADADAERGFEEEQGEADAAERKGQPEGGHE